MFKQRILWGFLFSVLVVFVGIAVGRWQGGGANHGGWDQKPLEGLKNFGTVPDFSLIERSGRHVSLSDLRGKIWITNFIYTNCPDTCPIQSAQMKELQNEFLQENALRLVSITVDPKRDTPKVLSKYAERFDADPERWVFLTGQEEAIYRLARDGFHLGAAEIPHEHRNASGATHTHSPRFVVVDRKAQIRGYYPGNEAEAIMRLRQDLKALLRQ